MSTSYRYDNLSRLLSIVHQSSAFSSGTSYTYHAVGNRTSLTPSGSGTGSVAASFCYDPLYELTQGTTTTESYTYDAVGNRLSSATVSSYTYNSSNELTSVAGTTFSYDNNGNTTSRTVSGATTTISWDFENRASQVALPGTGGTVTFKYDPFGRRIYKSSSSGTTIFAYDGDNRIEDLNTSGTATARYTQGLGIDEPLMGFSSGTSYYSHADGLGSITTLTTSSGSVATSYVYDSFGTTTATTGTAPNPFRYTGREFDSETGAYYNRARYYCPCTGRFFSEDPLQSHGDDINFYSYVASDPVDHVDPWGLCRILFNGSQITIETNNRSQRLGPFPASNKTVCNCGLKEGVYAFDPPQWLYRNGKETGLGGSQFDAKRSRHQAFGSARIPIEVVGRSGIMIHARFPDTKELKPTEGCVRVHDAVASSMSQFIDAVCKTDQPNSFHYYQRPW